MKLTALSVIVAAFTLLAACGGGSGGGGDGTAAPATPTPAPASEPGGEAPAKSGEIITLRYVSPGGEPTEAQKRWDAINAKLAEDGLNIRIEFEFIGWDAWEQKTNLMLSSQDPFDNLTIMEDLIKTSVYAGRGAIVPLDEYLDKYPGLKNAFPEYVWDLTRVDGKVYSIPVFYREWSNDYEIISYRKDLLEKYNRPVPKTVDELIETADTIKKQENDPNLLIVQKPNGTLDMIHRTYDSYPFSVVDELIYVGSDGTVKAWMETEEFKQDAKYFNEMYKRGLIHPDILTLPLDQVTKPINDGNALFAFSNALFFWNEIQVAKPEADIDVFRFNPEKPKVRPLLANNANAIPVTSKHPEAMIQFYDWLYSKQENFDLLTYGIEGDWFEDLGENKMKRLRPKAGEVPFSEWKTGYYKFIRFDEETMHPKLPGLLKIDDTVQNAVNIGFTFDSSPVSVEYANLLAEIKTSVYPLKMGVADFDEFYPGALNKMKAAGLDKFVEEYKRQFEAWLANK